MPTLLVWFWTAIVLLSIAWYAILLFYVGAKGGREIVQMTRDLSKNADNRRNKPTPELADEENLPGQG
jgi:hypothetical protein